MPADHSRWERLLGRVESGHRIRRTFALGAVVLLSTLTFGAGLMLRPTSQRQMPTPVLVFGTPTAMTVNDLLVRDPAVISEVVRDLNSLRPSPDSGISVQSCPNYVGKEYVMRFTYANGDHWTVIVGRDGCENVTAGGYWPRTSAFSNPHLLKDLDAIYPAS